MKSVSFRIRRQYFDDIVKGKKKVELRKHSDYWKKRLLKRNPMAMPDIAVFVCGKRIHRREIIDIGIGEPEKILGRPLSEQGKKDIPTEKCIGVVLGREVKPKEEK